MVAVGHQISPDRRRPGRMSVDLGSEPGTEIERTIHAYRTLLECVDGVLQEVDGSRDERARLLAYRAQFNAQMQHWRGVARRADGIVESARQ